MLLVVETPECGSNRPILWINSHLEFAFQGSLKRGLGVVAGIKIYED
jgi:hypothetical protein